ncbi:hypothetical protein JNB63_18265 [Microbacterium trichothecenolyticum]|uniref:PQ-loop repeat-containing protein n=1 Tax=Microbacterium ureisolvens TaxID=2781186 RepID=A0ABS7I3G5_9MICO|nr:MULTISPECIES: hypothetical protein [Microbacterium]MBW9111119.1 hypothetical protein [Microbacterium ureisolvens]MBW9122047.1 hypothetical protein [Microbacterium trichothecenolyticum]
MDAATLAGTVSTVLFAAANLPMVVKAVRSGDLRSYSLSALVMGNVGNAVYTLYVLSLPFGPIWILHGFYLTTMAIMLVLYGLSARARRVRGATPGHGPATAVPFPHGGHGRRTRARSVGFPVR